MPTNNPSSHLRSQALAVFLCAVSASLASAQLEVLSEGDVHEQWRLAQVANLRDQLQNESARDELKQELQAQLRWISTWRPGSLTDKPMSTESGPTSRSDESEPSIDPDGTAASLRERLLGSNARPTTSDTQALKQLLSERPNDVGVRQLHLHWLDQPQYRKQYSDEIAEVAMRVLSLLDRMQPESREVKLAKAYCLYRRGRALAYRELPEVVAERPIEDPRKHEAALLGAYTQLGELVGAGRPEFILLDIRMLRRDHWYGRALGLLEQNGNRMDKKWYLKKRRDLLRELAWQKPSDEAAAIYAKEFPELVAQESKEN